MRGKKGWLKIAEAFISVMLIATVVVIFIDSQGIDKEEISPKVYKEEASLLRNIQLNESLRESILNTVNLPVKWSDVDFPGGVKNKITSDKPDYLDCEATICGANISECSMESSVTKDVYAQSIGVFSSKTQYNPRQLKLFCWDTYEFVGGDLSGSSGSSGGGCTPDCSGRVCGLDLVCGESCGSCGRGYICEDGACNYYVPYGAIMELHLDDGEGASSFVDSSGNGNGGTCSYCPDWDSSGIVNGSYHLDGTTYITVPVSSNWEFNQELTVSAWFKKDIADDGFWIVDRWMNSKDSFHLDVGSSSSNYAGGFTTSLTGKGGSPQERAVGDTPINDLEWHHLVGVFDGPSDKIYIYLDGEKDGEEDTSYDTFYSIRANIEIGRLAGYPTANVVGNLDEIILWDRALNASEIQGYYNATRP
ncbi:MAG: LamG domain-containing protein [archaeon]